MDAVFAATLAPYERTAPAHPFDDPAHAASMANAKAIAKFLQVVLQVTCAGNKANQDYMGRRRITRGGRTLLWMDHILLQLEDPLGSAVTLSALLNKSAALMKKYATADLVLRFNGMIRKLGPQPRLVSFFGAICSVAGQPIKANQEMVLRLCWMREEVRETVMLQLCTVPRAELPAKTYSPIDVGGGKTEDSAFSPAVAKTFPPKFIGRDEATKPGGFDPVYVYWKGASAWKGEEALFFTPEELGLQVGDVSVERSSAFRWVMCPWRGAQPSGG